MKLTVLDVLFDGAGSSVAADIVAVFEKLVREVAVGAVAVMVMLSVAPTAYVARVHVTVCPTIEHVQPVPFAAMFVKPAGKVSTTCTVVAVLPPASGLGHAIRDRLTKAAAH